MPVVKIRIILFALLLAFPAFAQAPEPELRGTWTATAGSQTFRGSWGAEISARTPDYAQGWWTLLNESGDRVMQGTWTARKAASRWHGTWTAQVSRGGSFSGTWEADVTEPKDKTLADMLKRTLEREVGGFWKAGGSGGNWWLRGAKAKATPR
jgi:hypothetical protein